MNPIILIPAWKPNPALREFHPFGDVRVAMPGSHLRCKRVRGEKRVDEIVNLPHKILSTPCAARFNFIPSTDAIYRLTLHFASATVFGWGRADDDITSAR